MVDLIFRPAPVSVGVAAVPVAVLATRYTILIGRYKITPGRARPPCRRSCDVPRTPDADARRRRTRDGPGSGVGDRDALRSSGGYSLRRARRSATALRVSETREFI